MCRATPERDLCVLIQLHVGALAKMSVFHVSRGDRFTVGSVISHTDGRGSPRAGRGHGSLHVLLQETHKSQNACIVIKAVC